MFYFCYFVIELKYKHIKFFTKQVSVKMIKVSLKLDLSLSKIILGFAGLSVAASAVYYLSTKKNKLFKDEKNVSTFNSDNRNKTSSISYLSKKHKCEDKVIGSSDDKSNINHKNCENVRVENVLFNSKKTEKVVDKNLNNKECEEKKNLSNNRERIESKKDTKENTCGKIETTEIVPNRFIGINDDLSINRCDNKNEETPLKINEKVEPFSNKEVDNMPATNESATNFVSIKNKNKNKVTENLIEEDKSEIKPNSKKAEVIKTCLESLKYFKHLKSLVDTEYDLFKMGQDSNKTGKSFRDLYNAAEKRLVHMDSSIEFIKEMCNIEKDLWEEARMCLDSYDFFSSKQQIQKTIDSKTFNLVDNLYASICAIVEQFLNLFIMLNDALNCENIKQKRIVVVKKKYDENLKTLDENSKNIFDILKRLRRPDLSDQDQKLIDDTVQFLRKFITENKKCAKSVNSLI